MATVEEQIELEYQMVQSGIDRYNKQLGELLGKDLGSRTKHGRAIIKGIVEPVQKRLDELQTKPSSNRAKAKTLLKGMDNGKVAYLTLVSIVDSIANSSTLIRVARNVGIQVETQKRLDAWLAQDRDVAKNMIREAQKKSDKGFDHKRHGLNHKMKLDMIDVPNWSNIDRIHVGLKLIDIVIEETGIVRLDKKITKKKTVWHIVPTPETKEWIDAFNDLNQTALPRYSPCLIQPKDWQSFWGGGYYSEHINKLPFVRVHV